MEIMVRRDLGIIMTQLPSDHTITYQLQYRKCGKPTCRTCRMGPGHGPYWYAYWRDGSRLHSAYIGKVRPSSLETPIACSAPESGKEIVSSGTVEEPKTGEHTCRDGQRGIGESHW
jgi:hypothetical protein